MRPDPNQIPLALYVHFPWCVRKCPYCDFNSHPLQGSLDEAGYLEALRNDLRDALTFDPAGRRISTVFFGGGTPSLFSPHAIGTLIDDLGERLTADAEVTLEMNPGTAEHHPLAGYRNAGVNRLSIGAQTFAPRHLQRLGRIHAADDTARAFDAARRAGFDNINLDLMYALGEQTVDEAIADLDTAGLMRPEHLSWYQLTIEPKTEYARRPPLLPDDDTVALIEREGRRLLSRAGYQRYEVSAWARDRHTCQHNLNYWNFGDYLGIGAGAHGKVTACGAIYRTAKRPQPRLYLRDPAATDKATLQASELPGEFILNVLRLVDGVAPERFPERTGLELDCVSPVWQGLVDAGLMRSDRLATTERGYALLDSVVARFL